jgi:hypothetical protein|tara:strand:- start:24 stop:158 length:135 start_codon:yes stop_codon:yes gene_type:complete
MPFTKYTPGQRRIARVAKPRNKITAEDFKKLRESKKKKNTKKKK